MSFLWQYTPLRSFPDYSGPHAVGSCDVEVPVSELDAPTSAPDPALGTVSFRIFYPCEPSATSRPVKWIPSPQSKYGSAYARFLGASPRMSDILALFPQFLYMTRIPVHRNAKIAAPTTSTKRWPVMVFSHGLGGSRNAYSYICGTLASYGIIVIAPDHRDSSSPVSFVRATSTTESCTIGYQKLSHTPSPEVYQARDAQLRTRLWEMGAIHDAIVRMDLGMCPDNLDPNTETKGRKTEVLRMFKDNMDLHRPGSIIWAGHSFGAATTVQLLKHSYYGPPSKEDTHELTDCLFEPARDSAIVKQITSSSVALLLDMWCLPLRSKATRWLWNKPMPCYDLRHGESIPAGGSAICTVLSEAFIKWAGNTNDTKRVLTSSDPTPNKSIRWQPFFFYPESSAHLSQSDFGILFPWLLEKFLKTKEPERLMRLNARALLQTLRVNGYEIAPPSIADLEIETLDAADNKAITSATKQDSQETLADKESNAATTTTSPSKVPLVDTRILAEDGSIRGWIHVPCSKSSGTSPDKDAKAVAAAAAAAAATDDSAEQASTTSDTDSGIHVEEDYNQQTPGARQTDEAEMLHFQTPGREKTEDEAFRFTDIHGGENAAAPPAAAAGAQHDSAAGGSGAARKGYGNAAEATEAAKKIGHKILRRLSSGRASVEVQPVAA